MGPSRPAACNRRFMPDGNYPHPLVSSSQPALSSLHFVKTVSVNADTKNAGLARPTVVRGARNRHDRPFMLLLARSVCRLSPHWSKERGNEMKASPGTVLVVDTTPAGEASGCDAITARRVDHARARTTAARGRVGDAGGRCVRRCRRKSWRSPVALPRGGMDGDPRRHR